jgi:thioredoxin reductase (NADPH)
VAALRELKLRDEPVALVVSDQRMPDLTGTEVLKVARQLFAGVRTILLTAYADTDVAISAINDIQLDYYILKPWDPPEERLYPIIDDLLEDWHATHRPSADVTRVVCTRWSAASHQLREFLQRNQIPMQWLDVEVNAEAQRLMAAAGDAALPIVLTPDGQRLPGPDVAALAAALGHKTRSTTTVFDLAIVGAGPAGLAAAVYGPVRACRRCASRKARPEGRPASRHGSRTTWDSQTGSRALTWPGGRSHRLGASTSSSWRRPSWNTWMSAVRIRAWTLPTGLS